VTPLVMLDVYFKMFVIVWTSSYLFMFFSVEFHCLSGIMNSSYIMMWERESPKNK